MDIGWSCFRFFKFIRCILSEPSRTLQLCSNQVPISGAHGLGAENHVPPVESLLHLVFNLSNALPRIERRGGKEKAIHFQTDEGDEEMSSDDNH